ncbi:MAG: helix-turn-helix domain-containing protein [Cyanobacteria bacterium P01_F01_bin.143]
MNKQILTFKELREARGYTQESLAQAVGLTRLAISRYELKQAEPKLGNFLKIAKILEVSLAELALAMGYEAEAEFMRVRRDKSDHTPVHNEDLERENMQVYRADSEHAPAKRQSKKAAGDRSEDKSMRVSGEKSAYTPTENKELEVGYSLVFNNNLESTPAKRRAKGKGTGFIEERLVKRGNKQYKQYWFHWQKSEPGKGRTFATSKYIPKRMVAKIIEKNHQKLPVREILRSLGVK